MAGYGGKRIPVIRSMDTDSGILSRVSESAIVIKGKQAVCDTAYVAKRLLKSTGKAAWISTTTFLVLGLPLIIAMDREQMFNDADLQQQSLLGVTPPQYLI